jgi:Na+-transporting methylmalonyl-CoA/oxaloacetate decarboxylase gamma subunit
VAGNTPSSNEPVAGGDSPPPSTGATVGGVFLVLFLIALAVGLLLLVLPPTYVPPKDAGWLDGIFSNRLVMAATRIVLLSVGVVLLFAAAFIVTSIVTRMHRGEWIRRFGPFEVSEASQELQTTREEIDRLNALIAAEDESSKQLSEGDALIEELIRELDEKEAALQQAVEEVGRLTEGAEREPDGN